MKPFETYTIWKMNCFDLSADFTPLIGFGVVKARSKKEAQSKIDRKMRSGQHEGYAFVPALPGIDPNH